MFQRGRPDLAWDISDDEVSDEEPVRALHFGVSPYFVFVQLRSQCIEATTRLQKYEYSHHPLTKL